MIGGGAGVIVIFVGIFVYQRWKKNKKKKEIRSKVSPSRKPLLPTSSDKSIKNTAKLEVEDSQDDFEANEIYDSEAALNIASIQKGRQHVRPPWYILCKNSFISAVLLYFGIMLVPLNPPGTPNWLVTSDRFAGVGYFLMVFGSMIGCHFLLSLIKPGRKFLFESGRWMSSNVGSIILFLMTILYIPLSNSIFKVFACSQKTCSTGYEFVRDYDASTDLSNLNQMLTLNRYYRNIGNI
jgi:hypothetical protein